jgi:hypothetical protein
VLGGSQSISAYSKIRPNIRRRTWPKCVQNSSGKFVRNFVPAATPPAKKEAPVMHRHIYLLFIIVFLSLCGNAPAQDDGRLRFDGKGSGRTAVFETDGPWMLDWSTRSDTLLPPNFELRLHDETDGDFVGTVVQLEGTGSGRKLFETAGSFRFAVVASNVVWELEVSEVSEERAAQWRRLADGRPSLADAAEATLRRVREGSFNSWRAEGNDTLLLFDDGGIGWRATFSANCPGLESATAISFVTPAAGGLEEYDSILLDDGTRCYFDRVVPALLN